MKVTILTETELRRCVTVDRQAIQAIEDGFTQLANGIVTMPPVLQILIPENRGEVDVKAAYVRGLDTFAIKIGSGFLDNWQVGLPAGSGMMVLVNARTGVPEAVLLDDGYLTDVRTGAAGAVAARYLARRNVGTVGVIGSGAQARFQILALKEVCNFSRVLVYGRTPARVAVYVSEMAALMGMEVAAAPDAESVVRQSDIVVTTTPSHEPLVRTDWLHPGLHITAMGADSPQKQELEATALRRAGILACDLKRQCFEIGELHHGLKEGAISADADIIELGELTSGRRAGRSSDQQITICDLTGVGVQDTAIALLAYGKARDAGLGITIEVSTPETK
jgi:ectoine utilization protein EutC